MTYIPSLHKVQMAAEVAFGDGTAATIQLPGITNIRVDPKVEAEQLPDLRGTTMPAHEEFIKRRWSEGVLEGYVNYQEFYHYLDAMFGLATPVGTVRTYIGSIDWITVVEQAITEQSHSLRYGQTGLLYMVPGVLPYELKISGASGEPAKFSYRFFGHPAEDGATFNGALVDDVVEWAMGHHSQLYLDNLKTAMPGTTPMTDLGFRYEIVITSNRKPVWHLGDQEYDSWRNGKWGGSFKMVLEADATLLSYIGDIIDATATPRSYAASLRITDTSNILDIDFVGTIVTPPRLIPDSDGIVTVEFDLVPTYGSNAGFESCWGAEITIP